MLLSTQQYPDSKTKTKKELTLFEMVLFAMFGSMMFISKILLEFLPNVHMIGMFIVLLTSVYRTKALIPIYIFILLEGIYAGFAMWWIPYLYIWLILWGFTMIIPKNIPDKKGMIVYPLVCSLHGFLYGTLYAPAQALMYSLSFEAMLTWIGAGLLFDCIHGVSNFFMGLLVVPLKRVLIKLNRYMTVRGRQS